MDRMCIGELAARDGLGGSGQEVTLVGLIDGEILSVSDPHGCDFDLKDPESEGRVRVEYRGRVTPTHVVFMEVTRDKHQAWGATGNFRYETEGPYLGTLTTTIMFPVGK